MTNRKALEKAVEIAGGQTALARRLQDLGFKNVKQQSIHKWLTFGLPAKWIIPVERAVGGRVTRYQLDPEIYPQDLIA